MKAGLFVCDHVHPDYQSKFGDYPDMFAELFPDLEWEIYDVINGEFPDNLNDCDVYMATGSKHSVYEDIDWIHRLKLVIAELYKLNKMFIGFCFGHQLIGESLGGKVGKSDHGWCVGVHTFDVIKETAWMNPKAQRLNLLMMCQDQIIDLPPDTQVIAGATHCPHAIVQIGRYFLGIQAHPEFSKAYDRYLMAARSHKIGMEVINAADDSFELTVHKDLIREWILNFIRGSDSRA